MLLSKAMASHNTPFIHFLGYFTHQTTECLNKVNCAQVYLISSDEEIKGAEGTRALEKFSRQPPPLWAERTVTVTALLCSDVSATSSRCRVYSHDPFFRVVLRTVFTSQFELANIVQSVLNLSKAHKEQRRRGVSAAAAAGFCGFF